MDNKIYIFVSHSHLDIEKVRVIRNYLEEIGAEPILFFLKSKSDENEITELIKDEIDARLWFIYCQSDNSEKSKWVATEIKYIKETNKETNFTIDLDTAFDKNGQLKYDVKQRINNRLNIIKDNQTVYVSYSHKDINIVERIKEYMDKYDICFKDSSSVINPASVWEDSIIDAITKSDYFLIIITKNSINSEWLRREIDSAIFNNKKIVPVNIDCNCLENEYYSQHLGHITHFYFDSNNIEKSCNELMYCLIKLQEIGGFL